MKAKITLVLVLASIFCFDVHGYRFHLINNTMYVLHLKLKVVATTSDFTISSDIGRYAGFLVIATDTNNVEVWITPYSIVEVNNSVATGVYEGRVFGVTYRLGTTSGYMWDYIKATNMWGSEWDFTKGKSKADSLYMIIEDRPGGNIHIHGWAKGGGKSHKWNDYKKEYQDEMKNKFNVNSI